MEEIIVSGTIYGLHSGDGIIRYVGLTTHDPYKRFYRHLQNAKNGFQFPVYHWIRKHGVEAIEMEILEYYTDIPVQDLNRREVDQIARARETHPDLNLNLSSGGKAFAGYPRSPETVAKIVESRRKNAKVSPLKGKPAHPNSRAALTATQHKKWTPEQREKYIAARTGIPHTEEHKARIGAASKVYAATPEAKARTAKMAHTRWHTNKGVVKPDCEHCVDS